MKVTDLHVAVAVAHYVLIAFYSLIAVGICAFAGGMLMTANWAATGAWIIIPLAVGLQALLVSAIVLRVVQLVGERPAPHTRG